MPNINRPNKPNAIIPLCLILAIIFVVFLPCLKNGFVNWDDDKYIINNPAIQSVSLTNFKKIFTSFIIDNYHPVTIISYLFEYPFFKLNPLYYHLTNVILHLLNCSLVFWLFFIITGRAYVSLAITFLFGIHPLQVESVAWISERKNLLYALFFLGSIICYIYYIRKGKALKYYCFSILLFILSLLSKGMAMTLPLILFLIDYFLHRKPDKFMLIEKIPYFVLSLPIAIITAFCIFLNGVLRTENSYTLFKVLMLASYGIVFYLSKIFLPFKLSCLYPYYSVDNNPTYLYTLIISLALFVGIFIFCRRNRKIIFGSSFFLITILPVLQFIPTGAVIVTDRYNYIPSLGIFYIIAVTLSWIYNNRLKSQGARRLLLTAIIFVIAILSLLTWNRCKVWKNSLVLWNDAINKYPGTHIPIAYFNRGIAYANNQKNDKAVIDFNKALTLYYDKLAITHNYTETYKKLLTFGYGYSAVYDFLAVKFAEIGRTEEAIILLNKAVQINPSNIQAFYNLCSVYGNLKRYKEAIAIGRKVIELTPKSAQAHYNLSLAYFLDNQHALACWHNKIAIELGFKPEDDPLKIFTECRR